MTRDHKLRFRLLAQVYLPMSYVYGARATGRITPLVEALRCELYTAPYDRLDWNRARNECAKSDLYYPHPVIQARRPPAQIRRHAKGCVLAAHSENV